MNIKKKIVIIGMGYVGLPLAVEFGKKYKTTGYDIDKYRISELLKGNDRTSECSIDDIKSSKYLELTNDEKSLTNANIFIITVPTPIDAHNQPNLNPLRNASELVAKYISNGAIVIYESTVYPGATEEICVPILEDISNMKLNDGFYVGYSPERITPGDTNYTLTKITKVVSGSNEQTSVAIDNLYSSIISAGTYKAESIKVAEAAKVIENTQRDLNIALINELAIIFNKLGIDTDEVLQAAGTKWNFLPFKPGLVGGHCIGVDPYYLTHKAQSINYQPEVILSGRRINDRMSEYVASNLIMSMSKKNIPINQSSILIMGFTFKENCPDIRNTKVIDIYRELKEYNMNIDICDPVCSSKEVKEEYDIELISKIHKNKYDAVILAVPHNKFIDDGVTAIRSFCKDNSLIYDLKSIFSKSDTDIRL